jgi:hypothetical protein
MDTTRKGKRHEREAVKLFEQQHPNSLVHKPTQTFWQKDIFELFDFFAKTLEGKNYYVQVKTSYCPQEVFEKIQNFLFAYGNSEDICAVYERFERGRWRITEMIKSGSAIRTKVYETRFVGGKDGKKDAS